MYFNFQEEFDTHDPKGRCFTQLSFLRKRSKIVEIVSAKGIIFTLAQSGVCAAFSRGRYYFSHNPLWAFSIFLPLLDYYMLAVII